MTLWTIDFQAPLSIGFFRQENWNGLPFPPPEDLPDPGTEPAFPVSPALQADSLPAEPLGKPIAGTQSSMLDILIETEKHREETAS